MGKKDSLWRVIEERAKNSDESDEETNELGRLWKRRADIDDGDDDED